MNTIAEVRVLVFSHVDVKKALDGYASEFDIDTPDAEIIEIVSPENNKSGKVAVFFKSTSRGQDNGLELDVWHLTECLVKLCIEKKIPIPFKSEKTLDFSRDSVSLWINYGGSDELKDSEGFKDIKKKV